MADKPLEQQSTRYNVASKPIYFLCFLISLTQIIKFLPDPGLSLFINDYFSHNLLFVGLIYSLPAAGMLLSSEWCGRQFDRCRGNPALVHRYLVSYSVVGFILMFCQFTTHHFWLFASIRIAWGIVLAALLPALFALLSDRYALPGYAMGLANSFAKLGNLIGLLLGGLLLKWLPYSALFLIMAGLYGLFVISIFGLHGFFITKKTSIFTPYSDTIP